MKEGLKVSGVFSCYYADNFFLKKNKITNQALEVLATSLLTTASNHITHLVMLTDFVTIKPLEEIVWDDVREYISHYSAMAINKSLQGVFDSGQVIFQGVIDKDFNPLRFNAAVLIINGNEESSNEVDYVQTGGEKVFSIVQFDEIKKPTWSDFIAEWKIIIQAS